MKRKKEIEEEGKKEKAMKEGKKEKAMKEGKKIKKRNIDRQDKNDDKTQ